MTECSTVIPSLLDQELARLIVARRSLLIILFVSTVALFLPDIAMKLLGKTALVTGAARGIGRGCALELARAGADVAINDRERTPQAEAVVAEIQALGRHVVLVEGNVFQRPSCESVVNRTIERLGTHRHLREQPSASATCRFPRL